MQAAAGVQAHCCSTCMLRALPNAGKQHAAGTLSCRSRMWWTCIVAGMQARSISKGGQRRGEAAGELPFGAKKEQGKTQR